MMQTNLVLKRIITDVIFRSRLLDEPKSLDQLLEKAVQEVTDALHFQDKLMTEREVAERWPVLSLVRLRNMRCKGNGPRFIKFGESRNSRIFYKVADIETWFVSKYNLGPIIEEDMKTHP